jgi:hypothetical protein
MKHVSEDLRGAIIGFVVLLSKGLLDDDRWEWDIEEFDWKHYQSGFTDPTILRTTMAVFMNNLKLDETNNVVNYYEARFRAFQYFRAHVDPLYPIANITPVFGSSEIEEPDFQIWEA